MTDVRKAIVFRLIVSGVACALLLGAGFVVARLLSRAEELSRQNVFAARFFAMAHGTYQSGETHEAAVAYATDTAIREVRVDHDQFRKWRVSSSSTTVGERVTVLLSFAWPEQKVYERNWPTKPVNEAVSHPGSARMMKE